MGFNQLRKRIALVTGALGSLGTDICKKLASDGFLVAANHRDHKRAAIWQKKLREDGYETLIFHADLTDYDAVGVMIDQIVEQAGSIDVLVNNAGISLDKTFLKMNKQMWDNVINSNLNSVFNCTKHVIESMCDRGYGRIINISSVNAMKGAIGQTNYAAAKAAVHGFSRSLALEMANKGITVNIISPGYIDTDMVRAIDLEVLQNKILPTIPIGRLGGTQEVAHLVSFLASEQASFITGANYSINGGQHMY